MLKKALIGLLISCPLLVQAAIDENKYIKLYRREFDKKTAANLYASSAENKNAESFRAEIINYLHDRNHKIPLMVINKRWKEYLKQYPDQKAYKQQLANAYLDFESVKKKFLQNQYLDDYFRLHVRETALEDLEDRNKVLQLAEDNKITISDLKLEERLLQIIENQGGDAKFESFLNENNLNEEEIKFFVKTDLIKEALISKMLKDELELSGDKRFKDLEQNTRKPRYYFTQAYIPAEIPGAKTKILAARKIFVEDSSIHADKDLDPSIRVMSMDVPVSLNTTLFSPEIKNELKELTRDGTIISSQVSQVIETQKGFHLLQINGVEVSESISLEEAKSDILDRLKEQRAKDFNALYNFFESKTQS